VRPSRKLVGRVLFWGAIAAAVYFGNVAVQTHLGRRALEATGLTVHTLDEGLARARVEDKQVLAVVSAIWCPSCRTLDRQVLADPTVRALIDARYVFVRLEYASDEGKAFRERFDVTGFPRVLVLDPAGDLVRRLPVTYEADVFATHLRAEADPR
jgi:thiol:disulfide interchange protein